MTKLHSTLKLLIAACFILAVTAAAQAQASRTWVSGVGDDANPCSRTAPCKTFAGAISKTAGGGEIDALDPGGFGAVTITKSITLDGGGGQVASVLVAGTNGIVVAAAAGDIVILRNLRLDGLAGAANVNAGLNAIKWNSGRVLAVQNCYIFGFNNFGIDADTGLSASAPLSELHVSDTYITNCGGGIAIGSTSANPAVADLDNVRIEHMFGAGNGIVVGVHGHPHVRNTFVKFCGGDGLTMVGTNDASAFIERSYFASASGAGLRNGNTGSTIDISNTSIMANGTGIVSPAAGAGNGVNSHGNNQIAGNTSAGITPNPVGQQ